MRRASLRDQPDSLQIGIDDLVPIGLVLLQCWPRRRDACVVDDNLNWTKTRFGGVQRGLDACGDGDVHDNALRVALGGGDVINRFGQSFRAARGDCYPRSPLCKEGCKEPPKAA